MNIRKIFVLSILVCSSLFISGCHPEENISNMKSYEELYNGNQIGGYEKLNLQSTNRFRASYGYYNNNIQGYNNWYYVDSDFNYLDYDNEIKAFKNNDVIIKEGIISTNKNSTCGFEFAIPRSGKVNISTTFRVKSNSNSDVILNIYKNRKLVKSNIRISKDDNIGVFITLEEIVSEGDVIDFLITSNGGEIYINPTIDYNSSRNDSLYSVPEWGYYGDIHAYYHNDLLYLYHLRNLGGDNWEWYCDTTDNMFIYSRECRYDTSFVENHYMSPSMDLNDYKTYPAGARDCTLFYDEDVEKYRYLGLTYKERGSVVNCDLSLRTSKTNDPYGEWDEAIPLREFPNNSGEPECSGLRKINDTWYLYCGISGQSVHGVGGISYWKGEKGQSLDEIDWKNLPTYHLDGEDLCVPQIEEVGGRFYLFGWMPQNYASNLWGGYKNMPREVYVREDGLLGTRLDLEATRLLNRGKLVTANIDNSNIINGSAIFEDEKVIMNGQNNKVLIDGNYDSTFITFNLKMNNSTEAGYVLKVGNQEYQILIKRKADGTYLEIGCPSDPKHQVSSSLYFDDNSLNEYDIKIICEGGIIEFYVNDLMALSGRTALNRDASYQPILYSNGNSEFNNVTISRLAQRYDVYD